MKSTYVLNEISKNAKITIVTNRSDLDIFYTIKEKDIKLYPMDTETFLILQDKFYNEIYNFAQTELSIALLEKMPSTLGEPLSEEDVQKNPTFYQQFIRMVNKIMVIAPSSYYFEKIPHPIDFIHSRIRRKGKYLIGINIGEEDDPTIKPPVEMIVNLMEILTDSIDCTFVLMGTESKVREAMIRRQAAKSNILSVTDINEAPLLAQVLDMCNVVISHESFIMHLSLALKRNTVGLFAYSLPSETNDFPFLIKEVTDSNLKCIPCNGERCPVIKSTEEGTNCFYGLAIRHIADSVLCFLGG
jgi:ADP-heptose:LPS heptosyltransferase